MDKPIVPSRTSNGYIILSQRLKLIKEIKNLKFHNSPQRLKPDPDPDYFDDDDGFVVIATQKT